MSKELEALNDLFDLVTCQGSFEKAQRCFDIVEETLQRLESIDNSNPSEALECLERLEYYHIRSVNDLGCKEHRLKDINTIKQALLKAQKEHKALEIIKEKDVDIFMLRRFKTLEAYNNYAKENKMKELTKEEFNTLKEGLK